MSVSYKRSETGMVKLVTTQIENKNLNDVSEFKNIESVVNQLHEAVDNILEDNKTVINMK